MCLLYVSVGLTDHINCVLPFCPCVLVYLDVLGVRIFFEVLNVALLPVWEILPFPFWLCVLFVNWEVYRRNEVEYEVSVIWMYSKVGFWFSICSCCP